MEKSAGERALDLLEKICAWEQEQDFMHPHWLGDARDLMRETGRDPHDPCGMTTAELRAHLRPLPKALRGLDL